MATNNYSLTLPESGKVILAKDLKENFEKIDAAYDNYLPLTAGTDKVITGDLYIDNGSFSSVSCRRTVNGVRYRSSLGAGGSPSLALEFYDLDNDSIVNRLDLKSDGLELRTGSFTGHRYNMGHNDGLYAKNASGTYRQLLTFATGNACALGYGPYAANEGGTDIYGNYVGLYSNGSLYIRPYYSKGTAYNFTFGAINNTYTDMYCAPSKDNGNYLGLSSKRFKQMYSVNGVSTSSDIRLKKNVTDDYTKLIKVINSLRPVLYEYSDVNDGKLRFGFIAQEVEEAFSNEGFDVDKIALLRKDDIDPESDMAEYIGDTTVYSLNYDEFAALNAIKNKYQDEEILLLKEKISKQNDEIASLSKKLKELEEKLKEL